MREKLDQINNDLGEKLKEYETFLSQIPADPSARSAEQETARTEKWEELQSLKAKKDVLERSIRDEADFSAMKTELTAERSIPKPEVSSGIEVKDTPIYRGPESLARAMQDLAFSRMYPNEKRGKLGSRRLEQYAERATNLAQAQARAAGTPTYQESVWEDGGVWMETETTTELLDKGYNNSVVLSLADRRTMTGPNNKLEIRGRDETSRKDGSRYGGVRWYPTHELADITATKTKYDMISVEPRKLVAASYASNEILMDVGMLAADIQNVVGEELAFALQVYSIDGTGAPDPMMGMLNAPCKITTLKVGTQAAGTVIFDNIADMEQNMWPRGMMGGRLAWFYNHRLKKQFRKLFIETGDEGELARLWEPGRGGGPDRLDGIPAYAIEQCEIPGTEGDLILADMSQYIVVDKGGMDMASSIHVKFLNDQTTFKFTIRVDGQPKWKSALTEYKGTGTVSPIVTLEVRS